MSVRDRSTGPPTLAARLARRVGARPALAIALVLATGLAAAAVTITYTTSSTLTTGVTPAPIQFLAGDDAGPALLGDHVTSYAISANRTSITATVKAVPEATLVVGSLFKLQNVDDADRAVTLSTARVTNAYVSTYTLGIYTSGGSLIDTLTFTAASPSVTFTLPAGTTYVGRLTLALGSGAGSDNVALTNSLALSFA